MMGIVFEHSMVYHKYQTLPENLLGIAFIQLFKFVTIAFFIIGGFLINHKFQEYTPGQYLKNRFANTVKPWLFWLLILISLDFLHLFYRHIRYQSPIPFFNTFLSHDLHQTILYTSFWFIPNFLICISVLLIFKRFLYKLWFGILLGIVSSIYSVNIYWHWFIPDHTTALFGFVCYLWLGVYMNKHYDKVVLLMKQISYAKLIIINIILFGLATAESMYIFQKGDLDYANTLRITNIFFSLGMFALLLKIGKINWISNNLAPRKTTFGIYLTHWMILTYLIPPVILILYHINLNDLTVFQSVGLTLVRFTIIYIASFLLVQIIALTKYKWLIGIKPEEKKKNAPLKALELQHQS